MKKKLLIASLLIGLSLSIYGCSNTYMSDKETEADGTSVEHNDSGDIYCIEGLPRNLVYDNKEITVKSITFYEDKVDHAYSLYALVDFDMSGLTEDDIYWLGKDNDLDVIVYVDDEENEFDNERLSLLRTVQLPDGTYRFAFQMRGSYRYSLCGKSSDLVVYVTQGGKYKYKNAISLNDIGWQLRLGKLNTGYIIVCNNENVSTIQAVISPRNGADITKNIEINNIPFVYYLDMSNIPSDYDIQYKFLNENGEEIQ